MNTHIATLARLTSALILLFFLAFVVAEGPPNPFRLTASENLYAAGMLALYGGLALAWIKPAWGGACSVAGWLYLGVLSREIPLDWPLAVPAAIGLLFLLTANATKTPAPRWLKVVLYGPLPVFVLLCANEMFGNPPWMATSERPIAELAGAWSGPNAAITITPAGAVTGNLGGVPVQDAQWTPNRSWFGRLLRWRTDYRIRGTLAGGQTVNILLNGEPGHLTGTLDWPGRPGHARLRLQRQ